MRFACVAAARPNFMKIKPVLDALERQGQDTILIHTGQHYDFEMSAVFFEELGIRDPDHHLGVGSGTHAEQTAGTMVAFEKVLDTERPDVVVVVGDVNATLACAVVAAKAGPLVAHVEAGARSRDWTMPEEINRVVADRVSDDLFAAAPEAAANLLDEGYRDDQIHLVGNVMIDTLLGNLDRARERDVLDRLGLDRGRYALVTLHRAGNVDDPDVLGRLLSALAEIAGTLPVVFPVHPRTRQRIAGHEIAKGLHLTEPVGYLDFVALTDAAAIVLTDSGGVQAETTALGVPCLTLRDTTEWQITIDEGTNQLVGLAPERIVEVAEAVLRDGVASRRPDLWDGNAAGRIADVLLRGGEPHERRRPTAL